jgi:hypothetical protein
MPHLKKAELIEGVVYVGSPIRFDRHSEQSGGMVTVIGFYRAGTPGTRGGNGSTVILEGDNEPQPDALMLLEKWAGGSAVVNDDGYVEGPPELVVEVAASSASYDLHDKLRMYERVGAKEYLVWRVLNSAFSWFVLREGRYVPLEPDEKGIYRSEVFPGLWLDAPALLAGDLARALATLRKGMRSPEYKEFAARLKASAPRQRRTRSRAAGTGPEAADV